MTTTTDWKVNLLELQPGEKSIKEICGVLPAPERWGTDLIWLEPGDPVDLEARLQLVPDGVLLTGQASATFKAECVRCLGEFTCDISADLTELWIEPEVQKELLAAGDEQAEDMAVLDGDELDLAEVARDYLILEFPYQILCADDCQGLCQGCGEKWEDLPEDHHHEQLDPRWSALSGLKDLL